MVNADCPSVHPRLFCHGSQRFMVFVLKKTKNII